MTQDEALKVLKTGANVFLTGEPGSGKTYTVNSYVRWLREHGIEPAITASTGIAATHIGGMTIHSWIGIGVRDHLSDWDIAAISDNQNVHRRTRMTEVLIIDEVSMLAGSVLEMVDQVLRAVRERREPFGGMQIVVVGDFFQLPPVVKRPINAPIYGIADTSSYRSQTANMNDLRSRSSDDVVYDEGGAEDNSPFAFRSRAWKKLNPIVCYLEEQHRQEDAAFTHVLAAVRQGDGIEKAERVLKSRIVRTDAAPKDAPRLFSHNKDVDHLNVKRLESMSGKPRAYTMETRGPESVVASLKRGCLSPETLTLKEGARVMFTKNDLGQGRFANGTLGEVVAIAADGVPTVKTLAGRIITVEPMEWTMGEAGRILGRIIQLPLRLAWAITVHKSQGMTLDEAVIDLREAFEYGQGYVALSRVRALSGLHLIGWNERALETHPMVQEHDAEFKRRSADARGHFGMMGDNEHAEHVHRFVKAAGGQPEGGVIPKAKGQGKRPQKGDSHKTTLDLIKSGKNIKAIAQARNLKEGTIVDHIEQLYLADRISKDEVARITPPTLKEALPKIAAAFRQYGSATITPAHRALKGIYSFPDLKLARILCG